eukprot:CAMPEP_0197624858 /NCGR_PEP_ID=MMETSP1338-20131121/4377_1 /TAXON_ID=43686 ORGANISM="Pelagodinium beii, Strain RCC1491" /NCGR_SAMPLE_ID=MMETSP1338 /ASSEMBLY_ACC=CAM_ASM_000754 /LENGTH=143 /DNA_ID=CAMNT_0043195103 /DNA_START=149 /DNA_END=580 /DNA_ORIENTATION=-
MGAMPKMMESMKKLPELQKKLAETPSTGTALGGKIKVTITGDLQPAAVEIDESVMTDGLPAKLVSDAVLMAMQEAHTASSELSRKKIAELYADMGVPMPQGGAGGLPGMPGATAPAAPAPPPPPPSPPMDFDPAGLGGIRAVD